MKEPNELIAEVLSRFSVSDLYEQTNDALERGDELFYRSGDPIEITSSGETNMIRWWQIRSGEKHYEVRRFKNFVFCSCLDFYYTKRMCKHLAITAGVYCERCRVLPAKHGKLCYDCDQIVHRFTAKTTQETQ